MKICGTVRRPPERAVISAVKLSLVEMSISENPTPLRSSNDFARTQ